MTDDKLYGAFTSTSLPADQFHHEQHVPVAWLFVCRHHMPAAIGEFSEAIKRFAAAKGAKDLLMSDQAKRSFAMPDLVR